MLRSSTLPLVFLLTFCTCVHAEQSTDKAAKVTYDDHVKPIFRQHCLSCHNQGDPNGGLALDTYTGLMEGGGSGEVVYDDGDVEGSRLWQLVNHDDTPIMPPNQDKIPADQLKLLRAWLAGGSLEDSGSKAKVKRKNALAAISVSGSKPDGPAAMPDAVPQQVPVVTQRPAAVTAVATSPWAPLVAVAGQRQIVLYDSDTAELLGVLPFEEGVAQSLRFNRDGRYLIAGGGQHAALGIAAVYDITSGERVATVGDELDTVFDADANDSMSKIAFGGPQKMLRIFDAGTGELQFDLKKHTDWIYSVAFSPDGILVASGDRSGGLHLWEADTGRLYLDLTGHKGAIRSLAWRDDSNVLASASEDGTVKLWDVIEGKVIKSVNAHGSGATSVRFDHQGRFVTGGRDRRARLWDASGNKIRDFQPMKEAVLEVAITHDGGRVIYGDWTGEIVSAASEDPADKKQLPSNPAPLPVRVRNLKTTLASLESDLGPLEKQLAERKQRLDKARKPLQELRAKIAKLRQQSTSAKQSAVEAAQTAEEIRTQLTALADQSRDLHDQVIVARLAENDTAAAVENVAAAEQSLADLLTKIANQRRETLRLEQVEDRHQKKAVKLATEADRLAKQIGSLETAVAEAEQQYSAAKTAHDAMSSRFSSTQKKIESLVSQIQ